MAIELISERLFGHELVPVKITYNNGTILRTLTVKWMKVKKLKNNKNNGGKEWFKGGEKGQRYAEELLLQLIKGLVNNEQFELTRNTH